MAVSEDQRALLQLLLGGDTYERVAEVLGTGPDDVRRRAHAALEALETDPDRELPTEVVRRRLADLDDAPGAGAHPATPPTAAGGRRWALWILGAGAALAVAIVLVVIATGGGNGGDNTTTTTGGQARVVPVRLTAVGGSNASGMISVVRVADQPAVDLAIQGLRPSGPGQSYVLWFVGSGGRSLPIAFQAVGADGKLTGRTPIPSAAEGLLPSFDTAELTLTERRQAAAAVQGAAQSATLPQVVGTPVMRGPLR